MLVYGRRLAISVALLKLLVFNVSLLFPRTRPLLRRRELGMGTTIKCHGGWNLHQSRTFCAIEQTIYNVIYRFQINFTANFQPQFANSL